MNTYRTPVSDEMKHCKMTHWTSKRVQFKRASSSGENTRRSCSETAVRDSTGNKRNDPRQRSTCNISHGRCFHYSPKTMDSDVVFSLCRVTRSTI